MAEQISAPRAFSPLTESAADYKAADAASYDDVSESFDKFTRRFNGPLAAKLLDLCGPLDGKHLLDLGAGTGIVALAAAQRVGLSGRITGLDLSPGMLRVAGQRAREAGVDDRVRFARGDAESLDMPDGSFDAVVGLFSLFHFPNRATVLREVVRVLRPGGIACFGVGRAPPPTSLAGWAARLRRLPELWRVRRGRWLNATQALDAIVAEVIPHSERADVAADARRPFGYGPETLSLLRTAGLIQIRGEWLGLRERLATVEEFWELQATYSTFARKRLAAASAEQRDHVRRLHDERAAAVLDRGGVLAYPHAAFFAVGRKREAP